MKFIKQLLVFFIVLNVFNSCTEEEVSYALQEVSAPINVSAIFDIAQDGSGMVSATPTAEGASSFQVFFGDVADETPTTISVGETITHTYGEGEFTMRIVAVGVTGLTSELSRIVVVSFDAPSDLEVETLISETNPLEITVTPMAVNATVFDVYFGDVVDEEPTIIMVGEGAVHVYEEAGDYTVRVVARGAGAATAETSEVITISGAVAPVVFPITFDDAAVNYVVNGFGASDFGSIPVAVIDNPDVRGINESGKVLEVNKLVDAQVWAGSSIALGSPIDFTNGTIATIKVWSPRVDTPIRFKIEDSTSPKDGNNNPTVFVEVEVNSTVASAWEELSFDVANPIAGAFDTSILFDTAIVFPDFGNAGQGELFYFDDFMIAGTGTGATEPISAAPTPSQLEANVISMFSEAYMDVAVDTWRTPWSDGALEDIEVAGNAVKKYSALSFVGIETTTTNIDATTMTNFRTDIWTADATEFKIKLVDFGADGAFGGDDDVEHEITIPTPAQGQWVSLDIPLTDFTGLTTRANIAQLIYVGAPSQANTVFIDNVYFYNSNTNTATEPTSAAPTPSQLEANVISMFSEAYMDVAVDTWRTSWSVATLEDVTIAGNAVKKYSELDFVGIEATTSPIDASSMTHFHTDIWTADATSFSIKLVDFGADGAFGGGDDVEHQIDIANPGQGGWQSYDIPLADFAGLTTKGNIAQLIYVGQPTGATTIFVDNVYFHN